jgi:CheY-like chemotaxis protein
MNIQMPKMDGYEATRQIRYFNKEVIIMAQTETALEYVRDKVKEAGCNDYIRKPIQETLLLELIIKHINK